MAGVAYYIGIRSLAKYGMGSNRHACRPPFVVFLWAHSTMGAGASTGSMPSGVCLSTETMSALGGLTEAARKELLEKMAAL